MTTKGLPTFSPPIMVLRFLPKSALLICRLCFCSLAPQHNSFSLTLSQLSGETRDASPAMDHYQTDTSSAISTRGKPIDVDKYFYYEKRGHKPKPNRFDSSEMFTFSTINRKVKLEHLYETQFSTVLTGGDRLTRTAVARTCDSVPRSGCKQSPTRTYLSSK